MSLVAEGQKNEAERANKNCGELCTFRSLQAAQHDLERQKASDSLKKHLEKRPDREMLVERSLKPLFLESVLLAVQVIPSTTRHMLIRISMYE